VWLANEERGIVLKGIVDRFEGNFVVIEIDGVTKDIPKEIVDSKVKAGDCVVLKNGKWITDEMETKKRAERIKGLMEQLWED
jgi:hydrogenase maturation factor